MADEPLSDDLAGMQTAWAEWAASAEVCPVCAVRAEARQVGHGRSIVEVAHEPGCPLGEV